MKYNNLEINQLLLDLAEKVDVLQKFQIKAEIIRIMNLDK